MTDAGQLRQMIEQERERFGVVGLAVVVVEGGELVLAEGFGCRDLEQDLPTTSETLFAIASDTKAFTAALCAMFVEEGKLDWDAPIRDVLPWFRLQDPHASELVSMRDLLAHRTGLPRHDAMWFWGGRTPPVEEAVRRLRYLQPSAPLRQVWQYNNNAYTTAGYIAGELGGSDWATVLGERILHRLAMNRTTLDRTSADATGDSAVPYEDHSGSNVAVPPIGNGFIGPGGGIWSNADEMSRWVLARLEVPLADGSMLLSRDALRELHAPAMVKPAGPLQLPGVHSLGYGLAADIVSYRGHKLVHHGGGLQGFCSDVYLAPDAGHAVVVLANANGSGITTALPLKVLDCLLGLDYQPWGQRLSDVICAMKGGMKEARTQQAAAGPRRPPSRPLEAYAGTYEHAAYDVLEVRVEGDRLVPAWHDHVALELRHRHYDTWDLLLDTRYPDATIPFVARFGADGITGIEVTFEPTVDPIFFKRQPPTLSDEQLRRLAGQYVMGPLSLTVTVVAGSLNAQLAGAMPIKLSARNETHFEMPGTGTRIEFVLSDGAVQRVVVQRAGVFLPAVAG